MLVALQRAKVPASAMSVVVEQVGNPEPLIAWNASRPMLPASTMKLVTTFSGLSILGPDFRWRTTAYADGPVDPDGTLQGNLYIKGTGDPKLVPEELIDLVDKIRKAGIKRVAGGLVLDKSYFAASTRDLPSFDDDVSAPYSVGPDPLLYAFKAVSFTVTPGDDGKVAVDVLPPLADLSIDNQLHEGKGSCDAAADAARPTLSTGTGGIMTASFAGDYPLRCGAHTTNLAVVAPGIAEALLATALGLVAAIPAVVIYNHLARTIAAWRALLGDASAQVLLLVSREQDRPALRPSRAAE